MWRREGAAGGCQGAGRPQGVATQRGLRVGNPLRRLRRLYQDARRKPGARVIVYQDDPFVGHGSIITALIRHRRVASFQLWLGGAGE